MADQPPTQLQILIDVRARLDELLKSQEAFRKTREEAMSTGNMIRTGFGIDFARRAVDLFKETVIGAISASSQLASEVQRGSKQIEISGEAYQVLSKRGGLAFDELAIKMERYRERLGTALMEPTKGNIFTSLGLEPDRLAAMPLERQMESVALALDKVSDANVRARYMQELFGRHASEMTILLGRLRTDGYDKMRDSALAAGLVLENNVSAALKKASKDADEARTRIATALAPINLQFAQAKATMLGFFASNAGPISSGIEAAAMAGIMTGLYKGLTKASTDGLLSTAFANFGKSMAGPFGAAFAVAAGAFIIAEISRRAIEANEHASAFDDARKRAVHGLGDELKALDSDAAGIALYNKAVRMYNAALAARKDLIQTPAQLMDGEKRDHLQSIEQEIDALQRLIPEIDRQRASYIARNQAAHTDFTRITAAQTDLMVMEINHKNFQDEAWRSDEAKRREEGSYLQHKIDLLTEIIELTKKLPLKTGETEEDRGREIKDLTGKRAAALVAQGNLTPFSGQSDKALIDAQWGSFRLGSKGPGVTGGKLLSPMDGIDAGMKQWSMSLGSIGQQISGTIGGALNSVSQGLTGIITKTKTWGDLGRSVGQLILQTLIQIGVQTLVNSAISSAAAAKQKGESLAMIPIEMAKAGFKALSQLGPIYGTIAFGVALAAILGMTKGFATGGMIHGGEQIIRVNENGQESVLNARATAALGRSGVDALNAMRFEQALPGYSGGTAFGSNGGGGIAPVAGKPMLHVVYTDDAHLVDRLRRRPDFETVVTDIGKRRRGEIFSL